MNEIETIIRKIVREEISAHFSGNAQTMTAEAPPEKDEVPKVYRVKDGAAPVLIRDATRSQILHRIYPGQHVELHHGPMNAVDGPIYEARPVFPKSFQKVESGSTANGLWATGAPRWCIRWPSGSA